MRWEFTPDEFMHIWKVTGRDRYPFPLSMVSAVRRESDYDRLAVELNRRFPADSDPDLDAALRVAADPETTVALYGSSTDPTRAYAAIDGTVGVAMLQRPGPDAETGGTIVLRAGTPKVVPMMVDAVLGEVPKGSRPSLIDDIDRMRETDGKWTGSAPQTADRMRRLLRAPRAGSGHIEVRRGVRARRPFPPGYLSWFDVRDDGRYVYRQEYRDFRIDPMSNTEIKGLLARLTAPA
ncbi:ESX secretion-associated protein EspG [Nocardia carnea]|uniref:ESX secretion-associated protein EspG n=1 Tax=Nocardia carnea TaxID=37328 RepID=UPI002453772C|nr:ESX secretion-associated protein EspG [Nocardia carnea]